MLKIVVFDGGWGGELVADYLAEELQTIEIERVIDWKHAPYDNKTISEIESLSEDCLRPYVGKVDLIVLGGYATSLALEFLERQYPMQKFIGMGINYYRILKSRNYPSQVAVFVDSVLIESDLCQEMRQKLPFSTIITPDCSGWEDLINIGGMSKEALRLELCDHFHLRTAKTKSLPIKRKTTRGRPSREVSSRSTLPLLESIRQPEVEGNEDSLPLLTQESPDQPFHPTKKRLLPDVILLLNTHFWELRADFEELFGYGVRVLDFRQKLLHDTCSALSLRGVDGCRSK